MGQSSFSRAQPSPALPVLAALAVYAIALFMPQVLNDGDTYWHIAAGDWMLDHRAVLSTDPFSFTRAGVPWQTHEWLSEILMAAAFRAGGWSGLLVLIGGAAALAVGLLAIHLARWLDPLPRLVIVTLAIGCLTPSLLARPHVLALPALELWGAMLLIARDQKRAPSLMLLPLMTLWANLHGSFAFGLVLIAPCALEACIEAKWRTATLRSWAVFGLGAVAAALVTPHGLGGFLFPLKLMTLKSLAVVTEWRATDFSTLQPLELALMAALFVFLSRGVRFPVVRLATLLVLLHMALQHGRHQMLLGIVGALLIAAPLGEVLKRRSDQESPAGAARRTPIWALGGLSFLIVLTLVRFADPARRVDDLASPISALAHVPPDLRDRPVFNEYGFGGYLISRGLRPFIDGRTDLFGDAFVRNYMHVTHPDAAAVEETFQHYRIAWTILSPSNPLVALLDARPDWRRLYSDQFAVIHALGRPGP